MRTRVGRLPWRNMILPRRQEKSGCLYLCEVDWRARKADTAWLCEKIALNPFARIERYNGRGPVGRV